MICGITPENITELNDGEIFVFGSNLRAVHGAGAAYDAIQWGATEKVGEGLSGQTYALPTKDYSIRTRSIPDIYGSVVSLLNCINENPDKHFLVTKVGCGLAGYKINEIAPMFRQFLELKNCSLPQDFIAHLTGETDV